MGHKEKAEKVLTLIAKKYAGQREGELAVENIILMDKSDDKKLLKDGIPMSSLIKNKLFLSSRLKETLAVSSLLKTFL